jgi:hypothetical protein
VTAWLEAVVAPASDQAALDRPSATATIAYRLSRLRPIRYESWRGSAGWPQRWPGPMTEAARMLKAPTVASSAAIPFCTVRSGSSQG